MSGCIKFEGLATLFFSRELMGRGCGVKPVEKAETVSSLKIKHFGDARSGGRRI